MSIENILLVSSGSALCDIPPYPKGEEEDERYVLDDGESGYPCNRCEPIKNSYCKLCIGS